MTTEQIRIRLPKEEMDRLKKLAEDYGLNATALSTVFLKSALQAVTDNENRLFLPLRFKIEEPAKRK